jgi:FMN phosphatase YigB (HAD superfamily)
LFDLDDTLYNEKEYVYSGFEVVCNTFPLFRDSFEFLKRSFISNDKPFDELFKEKKLNDIELFNEVLNTYQKHIPCIKLKKNIEEMLILLKKRGFKLGLITDGRVIGQNNKVKSLKLNNFFEEIIITDELAGNNGKPEYFRKPNTISFEIMKNRFNVEFSDIVYIGDNYEKDSVAPLLLGMDFIHFKNKEGLYYDKGK